MSVLPEPDVVGYGGGNSTACHDQLVQFLQANPPVDGDDSPRALAFEIASKVGELHCSHMAEPAPLGDMNLTARKKAAKEHPGLCGVYHAHIIAAVKTQDVVEKWGEGNSTANKYRNQACFDGAMAMNARGGGVQLPRAPCFTEACRALWPGAGNMEQCVVDAFAL